MPLKLVDPREGKSPNFTIRGTYLGQYVDKSSGTPKRSVARARLAELERAIERGEYPPRKADSDRGEPTFLSAAVAYMEAGRNSNARYIPKLLKHFGETPLSEIDQAAIDHAAAVLFPNITPGTPATRNASVYTPVSAILHHAGVDIKLRRPKGAKGRVRTEWLLPKDASAVILAADEIDREFGLFLRFLLYTGLRLGEALMLRWDSLYIEDGDAWIKRLKGQEAGAIRLRADLAAALTEHKANSTGRRVFRFHQGGHLKHMLMRAKLKALGIPCPARRPKAWKQPPNRLDWLTFHSFRHTWASWMRRYGKVDVQGLVATGNWSDPRSAARYAHVVPRDEWDRVADLPAVKVG